MYNNWKEYCEGEILKSFSLQGIDAGNVKIQTLSGLGGSVVYIGMLASDSEYDPGLCAISHPVGKEFPVETYGYGNPMLSVVEDE